MPSDIMDQRHMSSFHRPMAPSPFVSEEMRFPSEKQIGIWKTTSVPDSCGVEARSFMSGAEAVIPSRLDQIRSWGGNFGGCLEHPHNHYKDPKTNIPHSFEHHFMGAESNDSCWRAAKLDVASLSKLYNQQASTSLEAKRVTRDGSHCENGLFSGSLSDIFNNKLKIASNDVLVQRSVNTSESNFVEDEAFESLEEIEAQTIGDLLPDDDDLLSGAIPDLGYVGRSKRADFEDDLFCNVGGLELEPDDNFYCKKVSESDYRGAPNGQRRELVAAPAGELQGSEQPTRTLLVKNIDSNMKDMDLRGILKLYGDIQTIYTSYRDRDFIIVSYYDIRAAQNALRVLRNKSIRGQNLDVQFCLLKDGLLKKEGVLQITNLEPSISNDYILHIFGVYGEIKEICGNPYNQHQKFVEFYDIRAAETALSALDGCDIAGKRIKVEAYGPRDARSGLQQISAGLDDEESSSYRQETCSKNIALECLEPSGIMALKGTSGALHDGALQGIHTAFQMPTSKYVDPKFHGLSALMSHNLPSPGRAMVVRNHANQSVNTELGNSLGQGLSFQCMPPLPDFSDGMVGGLPFNSPSTMPAMALNVSSALASGIDNRNTQRAGSNCHMSQSFEPKEAAFDISGSRSCSLQGHEYIWNNASAYHRYPSGSLMWQNLSPFMSNIATQTPQVHGLSRRPSHLVNPVLPPHQQVGSAPALDPLIWDRRHTVTGDTNAFHPSSLETMNYTGCSPLHSLELASHNIYSHPGGNCIEPSISPSHVGVASPHQRSHVFRGRNSGISVSNSHDSPNDRIRSRRSDANANQADGKKQYELDIDRIIRGEDSRTTLMIKNIPNKYTSKMLLATIDEQHKGTYDFIYLPIDFKNKCNVGYAFINMTDPQHIIPFYQAFNGKKWEKFNSEKVAYLAYARIQGKQALIAHFQNSSLMNEDKRCRPILFHSDGPNAGDQEPFPVGMNIRSRRSRTHTEHHHGSPSGSSSGEESSKATSSSSGSAKDSE